MGAAPPDGCAHGGGEAAEAGGVAVGARGARARRGIGVGFGRRLAARESEALLQQRVGVGRRLALVGLAVAVIVDPVADLVFASEVLIDLTVAVLVLTVTALLTREA